MGAVARQIYAVVLLLGDKFAKLANKSSPAIIAAINMTEKLPSALSALALSLHREKLCVRRASS